MWRIVLLVAALAAPGIAHAQSRFTGQLDIYSFNAPDGWTPYTDRGYADVAYDAPGGKSQGGIFAGLKDAERSLSDEVTSFIGSDALQERRTLTIDGMPCEFASVVKEGYIRNSMLLCHFSVPFSDGPVALEFFLGSAAPVASADWQMVIFWQAANSIAWGAAFEPAP
jgi:hypothetical protein